MAAPRREAKQKKRAYLPADDLRKRKPSAMGQMERINPGLMRLHLPAGASIRTINAGHFVLGCWALLHPVACCFRLPSSLGLVAETWQCKHACEYVNYNF